MASKPMQLTREILIRYFDSRGWKKQQSRDGSLVRLQLDKHEGLRGPVNVFFSLGVDSEKEAREVSVALDSIRQIYKISPDEVEQGVMNLTHDRLLARVPDEYMKNESIELRAIRSYLNGMRGLITAAATTEITGQRFFAKSAKDARNYADRCRFAHTFRGSFGLAIDAPIEGAGQTAMEFSDVKPPLGRRVIRRIATGFASLERAVAEDDPEPIIAADTGFNASMCKDVVGIIQNSGIPRIELAIALSPALESPGFANTKFRIESRQIRLLEDASKRMAKTGATEPMTVIGRIVDLHADGNPADMSDVKGKRMVQVNWESPEHGIIKVSISLEPKQYLTALEAHSKGEVVTAAGLLRRERGWLLENVEVFKRVEA